MRYLVKIHDVGLYLCVVRDHIEPQWWLLQYALSFNSAKAAREWLAESDRRFPDCHYLADGRVVRRLSHAEARERAALRERSRTVAFLRLWADVLSSVTEPKLLRKAADRIERGDHEPKGAGAEEEGSDHG